MASLAGYGAPRHLAIELFEATHTDNILYYFCVSLFKLFSVGSVPILALPILAPNVTIAVATV